MTPLERTQSEKDRSYKVNNIVTMPGKWIDVVITKITKKNIHTIHPLTKKTRSFDKEYFEMMFTK